MFPVKLPGQEYVPAWGFGNACSGTYSRAKFQERKVPGPDLSLLGPAFRNCFCFLLFGELPTLYFGLQNKTQEAQGA